MKNKNDSKRYYLHRVIKKKGFRYSARKKTIYIKWDAEITDKHVMRLVNEFRYSVQTYIY